MAPWGHKHQSKVVFQKAKSTQKSSGIGLNRKQRKHLVSGHSGCLGVQQPLKS